MGQDQHQVLPLNGGLVFRDGTTLPSRPDRACNRNVQNLTLLPERVDNTSSAVTFRAHAVAANILFILRACFNVCLPDHPRMFFWHQSLMRARMVLSSYPPFFKAPKNTGRGLVLVPADRGKRPNTSESCTTERTETRADTKI